MARKKTPYTPYHTHLLRWYARHRRLLPWRTTRDPYRILISEMMLQQTQVNRVIAYYARWLNTFPSLQSLAQARRADVIRAWSGLGYNNRALRLHHLAHTVAAHHRHALPHTIEALQDLPGIGPYTAHAVACFAYRQNVPVVDVNVRRVMTRWTKKVTSASDAISEKEAWSAAEKFLPSGKAYDWNQALMDLGSSYCTPQRPECPACPVHGFCPSAFSKVFLKPVKKVGKKEPAWKGVPRRIYRGRILKLIHHRSFSSGEIASRLWIRATKRDIAWLENVLHQMCTDGLVEKKRKTYSIAE